MTSAAAVAAKKPVAGLVMAASSRLLSVAAVGAALSCAAPLRTQGPAVDAPTVEDSVWAAVLDSYAAPDTQYVVVRDRTPEGPPPALTESRLVGIQPETAEDFRERNLQRRAIGPLPRTRVRVVLASEATLDSLPTGFDPNPGPGDEPTLFWRTFYRRFPRAVGLVTFSRVGFNAARTQAVVSETRGCGGLCGTGNIVLLDRDPSGRWRVARSAMLWVS
jgi:hypothetical protein